MKALRKTIRLSSPSYYPECDEDMRERVLDALDGSVPSGEKVLYLELRLLPYPHLINCVVTVP